jgi:hypothetical protein
MNDFRPSINFIHQCGNAWEHPNLREAQRRARSIAEARRKCRARDVEMSSTDHAAGVRWRSWGRDRGAMRRIHLT